MIDFSVVIKHKKEAIHLSFSRKIQLIHTVQFEDDLQAKKHSIFTH